MKRSMYLRRAERRTVLRSAAQATAAGAIMLLASSVILVAVLGMFQSWVL